MTEVNVGGCFLRSQIDHPSMEAMRATWAHTWLRFKLQLDRCRDAAMEQSGPPFSSRLVRSATASHFRRPCTKAVKGTMMNSTQDPTGDPTDGSPTDANTSDA
ncbi:hypothetical protein VPH35_139095 [Triticum aestivum]|uniref:uncharacterized protein n=1 Tax=Triticum aestivum TaxID=4565 RepID=UPI001D017E6E|nr:uncharacterized protein LOC123164386 [Triticum aestivum]